MASGSGADLTYEGLFRLADAALLQAKRDGRNRVNTAPTDVPLVPVPDARKFAGGEPAAQLT